VAVVGAGNVAEGAHLPAVAAQADAPTLVAVVDVEPARARGVADRWRIPAVYVDVEQMLAAEQPDLVLVCTPPAAHGAAVISCLDAGAWVWCEKPPALSLAEYDRVAAHERDGGPYVAYVFQQRFGAAARRLRRQIADGTLGAPLVGLCETLWYRGPEYYQVPWRGRWDSEGGGPTMGHGIHQMDLMLWLLGEWTEIRASMGTLPRPVETEDVSMAMVRFASGAMVSVVNSILSPREVSHLRFDFTDATVDLTHLYGYDNSHWTWTPAPHRAGDAAVRGWPPDQDIPSGHAAALGAMISSLRAGERPAASGADGRRVLEFIAALYRSAITDSTVRRTDLDPTDPFYHSMNGARGQLDD
jgi:predicted dehydrogenase